MLIVILNCILFYFWYFEKFEDIHNHFNILSFYWTFLPHSSVKHFNFMCLWPLKPIALFTSMARFLSIVEIPKSFQLYIFTPIIILWTIWFKFKLQAFRATIDWLNNDLGHLTPETTLQSLSPLCVITVSLFTILLYVRALQDDDGKRLRG